MRAFAAATPRPGAPSSSSPHSRTTHPPPRARPRPRVPRSMVTRGSHRFARSARTRPPRRRRTIRYCSTRHTHHSTRLTHRSILHITYQPILRHLYNSSLPSETGAERTSSPAVRALVRTAAMRTRFRFIRRRCGSERRPHNLTCAASKRAPPRVAARSGGVLPALRRSGRSARRMASSSSGGRTTTGHTSTAATTHRPATARRPTPRAMSAGRPPAARARRPSGTSRIARATRGTCCVRGFGCVGLCARLCVRACVLMTCAPPQPQLDPRAATRHGAQPPAPPCNARPHVINNASLHAQPPVPLQRDGGPVRARRGRFISVRSSLHKTIARVLGPCDRSIKCCGCHCAVVMSCFRGSIVTANKAPDAR